MSEISYYHLLLAVRNTLERANVPMVFWQSFEDSVKSQACLEITSERCRKNLSLYGTFRIAMNKLFTVHMVIAKSADKLTISIEGVEAERYQKYRECIQKAVDQFVEGA